MKGLGSNNCPLKEILMYSSGHIHLRIAPFYQKLQNRSNELKQTTTTKSTYHEKLFNKKKNSNLWFKCKFYAKKYKMIYK